jgi:hypothetical protein
VEVLALWGLPCLCYIPFFGQIARSCDHHQGLYDDSWYSTVHRSIRSPLGRAPLTGNPLNTRLCLSFPDFVFPGFHFLFSRILLLVSRILVIVSGFSLSGFSLSRILVSRIPSFRFCVESQYLLYGTWNSSFPDFTFPDFTFPDLSFPDLSFPDSGSGFPDFTYGFPGFYLKFPAFLKEKECLCDRSHFSG